MRTQLEAKLALQPEVAAVPPFAVDVSRLLAAAQLRAAAAQSKAAGPQLVAADTWAQARRLSFRATVATSMVVP